MRELDDAALEARVREVLKERLGALPLDLTVEALNRRREANGRAQRFGRGRGITLLAAAALLLVGGALAAGSGFMRLPTVVPPVPEPSVIAVATTSPDAASPSPSVSAEPSASPVPVAGPGGAWIPIGTLGTPRSGHAAVRLLDGRVLVVGGDQTGTAAELYDPSSGTWSATGSMIRPRAGFSATLLGDGKVLVGDVDDPDADDAIAGAEVYDPESGTWTATGKRVDGGGTTATSLLDGRVLVVGYGEAAELYDPETGAWTATGTMVYPRHSHQAILLPDGRVLVAGGHYPGDEPTALAELYDPQTNSWTATASMHAKHEPMAAFLQPNGKAIVYGVASVGESDPTIGVEEYDPSIGTWSALPKPTTESAYDWATPLSNGTVLLRGSCNAAALYDPRTGASTTAASMLRCTNDLLLGSSFTLLIDGTVLAAGGSDCNGDGLCVPTGAAELYVPAGVSLPPLPAFPSPAPPVFPTPTPRPTAFPPAAGPVPPNARTWKVTVDNRSSEPATLFVAEEDEDGALRLVGSASPNVVPAGDSVNVTVLFPAEGGPDGWIYVNPRPGEGGSFFHAADIGTPGKFVITPEGDAVWSGP